MYFDNSFSQVFTSAPWFVILVFSLLSITVLVNLIKGFRQWSYNNNQQIQTLVVEVVSKKADVTSVTRISEHKETDNPLSRYAQLVKYYVTFQMENGERKELRVNRKEYNRLAEKDVGKLTYQGTRYLGFVKTRCAD